MKQLLIYSETFIWKEKERVLFYNSKNGQCLEMGIEDLCVSTVLEELLDPKKLYCVPIEESLIENSSLKTLIEELEHHQMGRLLPSEKVAVAMPPRFRVLHDLDRMKKEGFAQFDLARYVQEITIFLGGKHTENDLYRQVAYPVNSNVVLPEGAVVRFLEKADTSSVKKIQLVISSPEYGSLHKIQEALPRHISDRIELCFSFESLREELVQNQGNIKVVLRPEEIADIELGRKAFPNRSFQYVFLVNSTETVSSAETLVNKFDLQRYSFVPIWNHNKEFLAENVFLNKQEILSAKPDKRTVFIHQALNLNYWGKILIAPDGRVYSDINSDPIGSLDDSLAGLVQNELSQGKSWLRTRDKDVSRKCVSCLYKWLCPCISPLEDISGCLACGEDS